MKKSSSILKVVIRNELRAHNNDINLTNAIVAAGRSAECHGMRGKTKEESESVNSYRTNKASNGAYAKREPDVANKRCFICKKKGHLARDCDSVKSNVTEEYEEEMSETEICNTVTVASARTVNKLSCVKDKIEDSDWWNEWKKRSGTVAPQGLDES
jgi:hypothetical protein